MTTAVRRYIPGQTALRSYITGGAFWLLAIFFILGVYFLPGHTISPQTAITGLVGLFVIVVATRWPDRALIGLVILLPFQGYILARLWGWGMPTPVVRHLGAWKEALALGVIVAGIRNYIATGRRADALDRVGLAFVALIAVYLVAQNTIIPSSGASWSVRLLAFRQDAGFVLLLLGARHAPFPPGFLDRLARVALGVAIVVAAAGVFESIDSYTWNDFVVNKIQYTRYQLNVLHGGVPNPFDIRVYGNVGGIQIIRVGSVFDSALTCGFYLVLGFALALERMARGRGGRWALPVLVLIGAGLLLTQTRSAILGALVVAWIAFRPAAGRKRHWRVQMGFLVTALAILAVPVAFSSGLTKRITAPSGNPDNAAHISAFWTGMRTIEHHPVGTGLGTSAGVGQQFNSQDTNVVVPENNYLQVGIELGVVGGLTFIALTLVWIRTLWNAARRTSHLAITAAWATAAGLAVTAWFLQVWINFAVAWTVWGVAGAALAAARVRATEARQQPVAETTSGPQQRAFQPLQA